MNNYLNKIVLDYEKLFRVTQALRELRNKIVVTIGSWDMLHIGHVRYLLKAKSHGDILVVGVDSDFAVKLYKGPLRPIVPESERLEMLSYQECVNFVTVINDVNESGKWEYGLIKGIKPDVFIAVEDSYPDEQIKKIEECCAKVVILSRQAENTSTSKTIQDVIKGHLLAMVDELGGKRNG